MRERIVFLGSSEPPITDSERDELHAEIDRLKHELKASQSEVFRLRKRRL